MAEQFTSWEQAEKCSKSKVMCESKRRKLVWICGCIYVLVLPLSTLVFYLTSDLDLANSFFASLFAFAVLTVFVFSSIFWDHYISPRFRKRRK